MAKLLLLKTDDDPQFEKKGDILATYEDTHTFSGTELVAFDILEIPGMTKSEVDAVIQAKRPEQKAAYRSKTLDWTDEQSEEKEIWKNSLNEWLFLEEEASYPYSLTGLKAGDRAVLEDPLADKSTKTNILQTNAAETISRIAANLDKVDKLVEV